MPDWKILGESILWFFKFILVIAVLTGLGYILSDKWKLISILSVFVIVLIFIVYSGKKGDGY